MWETIGLSQCFLHHPPPYLRDRPLFALEADWLSQASCLETPRILCPHLLTGRRGLLQVVFSMSAGDLDLGPPAAGQTFHYLPCPVKNFLHSGDNNTVSVFKKIRLLECSRMVFISQSCFHESSRMPCFTTRLVRGPISRGFPDDSCLHNPEPWWAVLSLSSWPCFWGWLFWFTSSVCGLVRTDGPLNESASLSGHTLHRLYRDAYRALPPYMVTFGSLRIYFEIKDEIQLQLWFSFNQAAQLSFHYVGTLSTNSKPSRFHTYSWALKDSLFFFFKFNSFKFYSSWL